MTDLKVPGINFPRIEVTQEFIQNNSLRLRQESEITERYRAKSPSIFEFDKEILLNYIPYEEIKDSLKEEYVAKIESGEEKYEPAPGLEETVQDFLDYMNFAWGKALDERGISASRSIAKLGIWLWILNRDDLYEIIHDDDLYNPYGAPALIKVCEALDIEVPESVIEFSKHPC